MGATLFDILRLMPGPQWILTGHLATALSPEKLAKEAAQEASTCNKGNSATSMAGVELDSHTHTMTPSTIVFIYKYEPSI